MSSPFILFGKPLAEDVVDPPLQVVGTLPDYKVGDAFEGRLDILNAIGKSRAEIVESSLPPGAYVYVDQLTQEVVLKWPAFVAEVPMGNAIPNGNFENGDDGTWTLEPGWTIDHFASPGVNDVTDGNYSAGFLNFGGVSTIRSAPVPAKVNDPITLTGKFRQGASSSGNLSGRMLISWCDADGKILSETYGDTVSSGSGNGFATLTVSGNAPAGTKKVRAGFSANRKRQNKVARVDGFAWTHKYELGTKVEVDYTVTVKVTDSANRAAYWTGGLWFNSFWLSGAPYPVYETDHLETTPFFVEAYSKLGLLEHVQAAEDYLVVTPVFVSALTKSLNWQFYQEPDSLTASPLFVSASTKLTLRQHVQPGEDYLTATPNFTSAQTKQVLVTNTIPAESLTVTPSFTGASLT